MSRPLDKARFPWSDFRRVCREGLGAVRPFCDPAPTDPHGWNFGSARPPSYWAYGRMRALLAVEDCRELRPRRVLEVAAGDGALCAVLAGDGCEVTANDLRTDVLARDLARFRTADRVRVVGGNLFDLDPAALGPFDLVVACEVVEHVAHTVEFLAQLRRFVAPGGHALVTTPNGAFFRNRLPTWSQVTDFEGLESRQFQPDADGHLFLITPGEMADLAGRAGFGVERLYVWGTPFLTGNAGMSRLSLPGIGPALALGERVCAHLPGGVRRRLCTAMVAVLKA